MTIRLGSTRSAEKLFTVKLPKGWAEAAVAPNVSRPERCADGNSKNDGDAFHAAPSRSSVARACGACSGEKFAFNVSASCKSLRARALRPSAASIVPRW